jgi:hypothetical protein
MEYLMTYGWAILVIIIVIAVLFYIGVLNPKNVTPTSCTFPPGMTCASFKLVQTDGTLDLRVGQATGHPIQILNVICTQASTPPDMSVINTGYTNVTTIPIGEQRWLLGGDSGNDVKCLDSNGATLGAAAAQLGEFYKGKIWIQYNETDTGMSRTVVGDLATKFETS